MEGDAHIAGTLAVIGGGRMGEAILAGLLAAGTLAADRIIVAEPNEERRGILAAAHDVRTVAEGREAAAVADIVLLAVKPQVMDEVVSALAQAVHGQTLVVSIAAGISCARLESLLPSGTAVVRVMPNTPAMVREGMSVISGGSEAGREHVDLVRMMFSSIGKTAVLEERYQDAATAISGSGPAYAAMFVDALALAGVRHGLPRDIAQALAVQTVRGTMALLESTGQHPAQLIDGVSSPGGTTIAALEGMEAGGFRSSISSGVAAAVRRAKELGS